MITPTRVPLIVVLLACGSSPATPEGVVSTESNRSVERSTEAVREISAEAVQIDPYVRTLLDAHGMSELDSTQVKFTFRGDRFDVQRRNGRFVFSRTSSADGDHVVDRLDNDGFSQTRNGTPVPLDGRSAERISSIVNSVVYFAMLPFPLADAAVRLERLTSAEIDDASFERLRVSFTEEGGGEDHDDEFLYWFEAETKQLRFMAYRYNVGGGGVRFRAAKNVREVNGVTFFDYDNFSYSDLAIDLEDLPSRRAPVDDGPALELLSEVLLENIEVVR